MKKNKRLLCRLCPLFLVILLIVPVAVPVSAATAPQALDYRDYIKNVTVDGSNDLVTISFPKDLWYVALYDEDWNLLHVDKGAYFNYEYDVGHSSSMPLEISCMADSYLSLDNIPTDATWSIRFAVAFVSYTGSFLPSSCFGLTRNWNNGTMVNRTVNSLEPQIVSSANVDTYTYETSGTFTAGYDGWSCDFEMYVDNASANDYLNITIDDFNIQLSINSYYRVLQEMGYTEQIDELKQELEAQGQTLDGILESQQNAQEYVPQVSAPPVQGDLDSLQGVEDNLMNDVNAGFDKAHEYQEAAGGVITSLYIPLMAVSSLLSQLIGLDTSQIPGFYQILMVSMGLGLVGVLLNLGVNYVRSKAGDH